MHECELYSHFHDSAAILGSFFFFFYSLEILYICTVYFNYTYVLPQLTSPECTLFASFTTWIFIELDFNKTQLKNYQK